MVKGGEYYNFIVNHNTNSVVSQSYPVTVFISFKLFKIGKTLHTFGCNHFLNNT